MNWCPALGTVLANEEVIDGLSERGSHPVVRLPMKQAQPKLIPRFSVYVYIGLNSVYIGLHTQIHVFPLTTIVIMM